MAIISRIPHSIIFCILVILLYGSITPVYSQTAEPETAQQKIAYPETVIDEVKRSLQRLEDKERQNYERELEGQRKSIDWLFSALALVTAIVALIGVGALFMVFQSNSKQMQKMLDEVKKVAEKIRLHEESAKQSALNAQRHEEEAEISKEKISSYRSDQLANEIENQEITKAAEQIQHDPQFDPKPGLRAAAIEASLKNQPEKAYKLWEALAELESSDIYALFNAGYWAQRLAEKSRGDETLNWLKQASNKYKQALSIDPDFYGAMNNLGLVLVDQAEALASNDLSVARGLWQAACEQYQKALNIKLDFHEAANNWGTALAKEAQELAKSDLFAARELWHEAGAKYKQALSIKPDSHGAASNWGSALSQEAQELAKSDLAAASKLWQEAGKKFQRVLSVKPDFYVAIDSWGTALLNEANAISVTDGDQANELRDRAEKLLLQHAKAAPEVVAYNLACVYGQRGDVSSCLHWLKTAQTHNKLVSCEHLQTDSDLDAVRDHPDFQAWLQSICPR